jgi:uncharacterized protein (TIGR00661 family)
MKVLYAIQGTGNGHISRARDIIPHLREYCECDILMSGTQCDVELGFPVKYRLKGLSFIFGKKGGIDLWRTTINSSMPGLRREIEQLRVVDYDFVINDFEPVSAWACRIKDVPCISLSHQGALLGQNVPLPEEQSHFGRFVLRNYAPASTRIGFHFQAYDDLIYTPVIRQEVREADIDELDYYTVYLPSFDDKLLVKKLSHFGNIDWHVFSKHSRKSYSTGNVIVKPITNAEFVVDMAKSKGVLCGAGFETPAEALYLNKKLMVIPMNGQYEQHFNAAALKKMGVPVINSLKKKHFEKIGQWLDSDDRVEVFYPDQTRRIVRKVFEIYLQMVLQFDNRNVDHRKKVKSKVYQMI